MNGSFRIEDEDIVRLESPGRNDGFNRSGWVNVGAFALSIVTDAAGNLFVGVYPATNEVNALGFLHVTKDDALAAGATDLDEED